MKQIMIDLETMGQTTSAPIIAIGACEVGYLPETFYRVINLESAVEAGGIIDPVTVQWWLRQPEEARAEFASGGEELQDVLISLARWLEGLCPDKSRLFVWANGASFDFPILAETYRRIRHPRPWHWWNERDYRTIKALYPLIQEQRRGTKHNALDDARSQAEHLHHLLEWQYLLEKRAA